MSDAESTHSTTTSTSTTKSTSRSQSQTFPLAHPPPAKHSLRLTSHLLLQIQQLTAAHRPTPILECYQPSCFGKSSPKPGCRKLTSRDIYIVQSEGYAHLPETSHSGNAAFVGAIHMPFIKDEKKVGRVWIPFGEMEKGWEVSPTGRGYRFHLKKGNGSDSEWVLEWSKARPSSSGSSGNEDRFALSIADAGLRRPWLATLTKRGLKVRGWDRAQREYLGSALRGGNVQGDAKEDAVLYTCVLTMGVYVAAQEGWLNRYV